MRPSLRHMLRALSLIAGLAAALVLSALLGVAPASAQTGPPGTPTLLAPANGNMSMATTGTLSWTQPAGASPGTTQYSVFLWDWDTNQNLPSLTTTSTSLAVPASEALQPGQRYFWSVQACNGANCSATSGSWQVFVSPPAGAPGFVAQTGATASQTPTLSWQQPSGATAGSTVYVVALIDDASGSFLPTLPPTTALSTTVPPGENLALSHTYDWAVNACNGSRCSDFGNWASFTTASTPGTPLQTSPANGATGQSPTLTLSWSPPAGAIQGSTTYTVSIWDPYGDPDGHLLGDLAVPAGNCTSSSCSSAVPAGETLLYGQNYEWNVSACNGAACSGYAGSWFQFTTQPQPAVTASGATPGTVYNPDFGGTPLTSWGQTPAGWTVTAPTPSAPSTWSVTSSSLTLDFPSTGGTVGGVPQSQSYALFRIGYLLAHTPGNGNTCWIGVPPTYYSCAYDTGSQISVSWVASTCCSGSTPVFADQAPGSTLNTQAGTWTEQAFAVPAAAGATGQIVVTLIGNPPVDNGQTTVMPSLAYVERLDAPAGRGTPHLGLSAEPRFPKAVAATEGAGVDIATGAFTTAVTDLALPSLSPQVPLSFSRAYYGQGVATPIVNGQFSTGPLGAHWTDNWQAGLTTSGTGGPVVIATPGGGSYSFNQSGGSFFPPKGVNASLVLNGSGQYVLTTANFLTYIFSPMSGSSPVSYQLTGVADRNGQGVGLSYTGTQLTQISAAGGRAITLSWNGDNTIAGVSDSAGRGVGYTYSGGNLTSVTTVLHGTTSYGYTGDHLLASIVDPLGNTVLRTTYSGDHVSTQQDAAGGQVGFGYGAGVTSMSDQRGKVWTTYWDAALRTTDIVAPVVAPNSVGVRSSWTYDADNNVTRVENTQNVVAAYTYDSWGNRLTATDALGYTTTYTYCCYNNVQTVSDPRGFKTTNGYDSHGNRTSTTNAAGFTTTYTLTSDGTGHVASASDPLGHTTSYGYTDSARDLTSVTDALGHTTTMAYDAVGRQTAVTDALNHTTSTTYDAAGDVLTVTDALGNVATNTYNAAGQQLTGKAARTDVNQTTTYTYDPRGLLKTVTDPNSGVTTYGYDLTWNRTSVQDARGKTTNYTFTDDDQALTVTDPLSRTLLSFTYDTVGRVATRTDGRGVVTTNTYDARSQLKGTSYSNGTPSVSAEYDAVGNRVQLVDGTGTTTYAANALNQRTQVTFPGNRVVQYGYDAAGNRTQILYPSQARPVTYAYDNANRLTSVTDWNNAVTAYSYDAANRLTQTTLPASTGVTSAYAYDTANRLTAITHAKGSTTLAAYSYALDPDGNRTAKASSGSAVPTGAVGTESYTLDVLNRLTHVTYANGGSTGYTLDTVGNRTQMVNWLGTTGYTLDNADQLTSVSLPGGGTTTYSYDQNGNTTARGSDSFTWDGENRLTAATISGHAWSFTYNGDGLRFTRSDSGGTAHYTWDLGTKVPQILDDGSGQYVYGVGLVSHIVGSSTLYYLPDALGTTNTVVDSSGNVVLAQTYDEYGNLQTRTGSAFEEPQFAGQQSDPDGLQYLRARYYDPSTGRFLSRDSWSVADKTVFHPYVYAADDPTSNVDPSGHDCIRGNVPSGTREINDPSSVPTRTVCGAPGSGNLPVVYVGGAPPNPLAALDANLVGPGVWLAKQEYMSDRARAYQSQVTGASPNTVYRVYTADPAVPSGQVDFDGYANGYLIDAKGPGYAGFVGNDGRFEPFFQGQYGFLDDARRQLAAAGDTPIVWYVAEEQAADAIANLFFDNGITGITVVFEPPNVP